MTETFFLLCLIREICPAKLFSRENPTLIINADHKEIL